MSRKCLLSFIVSSVRIDLVSQLVCVTLEVFEKLVVSCDLLHGVLVHEKWFQDVIVSDVEASCEAAKALGDLGMLAKFAHSARVLLVNDQSRRGPLTHLHVGVLERLVSAVIVVLDLLLLLSGVDV